MSAKHWFSGSYQEARKRFLDSIEELRKKGFEVSQEQLPLNLKGPQDEDLIIDLAVVGSLESENLLVKIVEYEKNNTHNLVDVFTWWLGSRKT